MAPEIRQKLIKNFNFENFKKSEQNLKLNYKMADTWAAATLAYEIFTG